MPGRYPKINVLWPPGHMNLELGIPRRKLSAYYDNGSHSHKRGCVRRQCTVRIENGPGSKQDDGPCMDMCTEEATARITVTAFLSPSAILHPNQLIWAAYNGLECTVLSAEDIKTN